MRIPGIPYVQGRNDYTDWDQRKYGIAIHNTSNDASDEGEASYATRRTDGVSSHLYVDDDSVTQSLDTEDRAGHAGSTEGNDHSLAVEITGANGKPRSWWLANVAWDKLGRALAWVITNDPDYEGFEVRRASVAEMRRNPRVKAFYGHNDMRLAWGGTTHTDPGPNFPWDRLFRAVNEHLEEDDVSASDVWGHGIESGSGKRMSAADRLLDIETDVDELLKAAKAAEKRDAAILAAVGGLDTEAILARIDQRSAEDAARDAGIAELVRQGQAGEVAAEEVVRLLGLRLSAAAEPADGS